MKKDNKFLDPISEERKSQVFIGDRFSPISSEENERYNDVVESPEYASAYKKLVERVLPAIDIREPSTWATYGSAEKYYKNSFEYIHNSYPYDGSALEKINWSLSASTIDLAVLQHEYPLEVGHVGFSTSSWGDLDGSKSGRYGLSDNPQYIKFSGGPYVGTVLDSATKRESSLKIDPSIGNTVEFWLRKNSFIDSSKTESEIVFDSHTVDSAEGTSAYGRFLLELSASSGSPVYVTYMSGTAGANRQQIGQNLTTASIADGSFHHYALTAYHTGSKLQLELYVDGAFNHKISVNAASMGSVDGYFNASLGALRAKKDNNGGLGYGKLSGSIDEFRFWKVKRTAEEIGNYFDFPVNGATDEERINSDLGVYFKFNEGITNKIEDDKIVLDYSGRLNNGEIVGYVSGFRSNKSAITISSTSTQIETGDPSINSSAANVKTSLDTLVKIGQAWDEQNHASLFKSVPQWAYDSRAGSNNLDSDFSILLQAIGQKFDAIKMLIDGLPKIGFSQYRDYIYAKGTVNHNENFYAVLGCEKDFNISYRQMFGEENFSVQNLLGKGFRIEDAPIASRADLNEYFYNLKFGIADSKTSLSEAFIQSKVENTKNKILNAIHANLPNIYKTKGTHESFRNLIRCFGVDESLISLNVYGQNVEKILTNSTNYEALRIKSMAFTGSNNGTVLLQTASAANERNYIEGKSSPSSLTAEANILFPYVIDDNKTAITASVFGLNEVEGSNLSVTAQNNSGFRVQTIKSSTLNNGCYFRLTSSAAIFDTLTTDYFSEVYANVPWYLAVKYTEDTSSPLLNSDNRSTQKYKVEFVGYRYDIGVKTLQFHLTSSITEANYQSLMAGNKSFFLGADRQNIIGSLSNIADSKALTFSVWDDNLSLEDMQYHAKSLNNIGREHPLDRKTGNQGPSRLQADTLILNWQFDDTQELNTSTSYIYDFASGSSKNIRDYGPIVGYKYPAVTYNLQHQRGAVQQEFLSSVRNFTVDNLASESKIEIKAREVDIFELDSRPVTYLHSYEKSMYQVISKEMLNMLSGIESYNNLIGDPVYKYRQEYKSLEKLRERFFSKVENDIDLERFIEYYKWIDGSLAKLLQQLQPATTDMNLGLQDVVESHALERSKYKHQAPQFEYKDPKLVGQILGVNELLYDWQHGHAPLSNSQSDNCLWWNDRASRILNKFITSSSDSANKDREELRQRKNTDVSGSTYVLRKLSKPYKFAGENSHVLNIGSNRKANKNKSLYKPIIATGKEIKIESSDIYEFKQCNDVIDPQEEKIYTAKTDTTGTEGYLDADADMVLPFSLYSSSAGTDFSNFKSNLKITNNHDDDTGVIQSPHMRSIVGGMPHRRVKFATPGKNRPEAYNLVATATTLTLKQTQGPKSYTPRGLGIATNYSIRNIKANASSIYSSSSLGNYTFDYDIVMTSGRNVNNSYLIESGSIIITPVSEGYVAGLPDFTSPVRGRAEHIIVNQFSSPGGPETQGVYGRDKESGEYSVYNTLNYRNLSIRQPLNKLSAEKSEQFGFRLGSTVNASMHMTNRNHFYSVISGSDGDVYGKQIRPDNQFVQHAIPQNDFGYSWITASALNSKFDFVEANDGFGHQHMFDTGSAKAIQFLSASLFGSYVNRTEVGDGIVTRRIFGIDVEDSDLSYNSSGVQIDFLGFIPVDLAGLNTHIVDETNTDTNTIGQSIVLSFDEEWTEGSSALVNANYINQSFSGQRLSIRSSGNVTLTEATETSSEDGDIDLTAAVAVFGNSYGYGVATILNSIILNRQGPYGWPTWKQLRGGNHPIIRAHRKTNTFSRVFLGDPTVGVSSIIQAEETPSMNIAAQTHRNISSDAYVRARFLDDKPSFNKSRMVKNYIEPIASTKSKPIRITIHGGQSVRVPNGQQVQYTDGANPSLPQYFTAKREEQPRMTQRLRESLWVMDGVYYEELNIPASKVSTYKETLQNDLTTFSNEELIKDIRLKEKDYHKSFDMISNITIDSTKEALPLEVSYLETIYPREANAYTENARERVNFDYFPFNSSRDLRNQALTGNISNNVNNTLLFLTGNNGFYAFSEFVSNNTDDYKNSIFGKFDILRLGRASSTDDSKVIPYYITSSTWVLDSRKDFTTKPVDITKSFLNDGNAFLVGDTTTQGKLGEGLLQNDFSTFPLGMNNLYGTPPISLVYNRRIPQPHSTAVYLSGEAKWEAADTTRGPFYDSYSDYSEEIINVAPDHSIVPEFRMSEIVEDAIRGDRDYPNIGNDFLTLTGAIYQNSSGDVNVGGNFFKTYSNSDFLKYFSLYDENTIGAPNDPELPLKHARINLKCKAAMKFLPYKGFYPAERAVELAKLFNDNYLSDDLIDAARVKVPAAGSLTTTQARRYAKLRANASRYQASKPLFGPGLLLNSIKSGIAVDYPIFSGSFDSVYNNLPELTIMTDFSTISMPSTNLFTGSLINNSLGASNLGIPRLTGSVVERIQFEDLLSPTNIFGKSMYDNEPHPSASLIYGDQHFHKIIERPGLFGRFDEDDAQERLGITFANTRRAFSRQISPYTMASQNFAAETVNFFLEDGHLTTAISKPIRERFEAGTYKMRVHLNNINTVMYDRHSAFGPPVDDSAQGVNLTQYTQVGSTATKPSFTLTFNDHHGSGGSVQYNVNAATASHFMPQLVFTDENNKSLHVFLYNEDHFTAPSNPSSESGAVKIYLTSSANAGVKSIFTSNGAGNHWAFGQDDHVALINVKNALGTAVATSFETALTNADLGLDVTINKSSNNLTVTSNVFGPRNNFSYAESQKGDGEPFDSSAPHLQSFVGSMLTFPVFNSSGLPSEGSYQDGTTGEKAKLEGKVYTQTHSGFISIITDGEPGQPASFTTSTVTSKTEHGFAPFVPPFLDPNATPYVEITFTPTESRVYGAPEIIEKSTYEYYNFHTAPSNANFNTNYKQSMSLSASLNLGMCVTLRTDNLEQIEGHQPDAANGFNLQQVDPNNLLQRWVIQTKWETPVMDFSDVKASAYNLQTDAITQVSGSPWKTRYWDTYYERGLPKAGSTTGTFLTGSTGMWHQKGTILNEKDAKGYFLSIKDVAQADGSGGLAEKLGFNNENEPSVGGLKRAKNYRSRIGLVEDRKIVKEAIVAIPYTVREDLENIIEFVKLNDQYYQIAKQNVEEVRNQMKTTPLTDRILTIESYNSYKAEMDIRTKVPTSDAPIDAIEYQLFMMDEYILPPQFDFTRVPRNAAARDIPTPFMMYFFQFHASFDREDLSNIWQNLYPKSPESTASPRYSYTNEQLLGRLRPHNDISYVSHYLETVELNGSPLCPADNPRSLFSPSGDNKTRWMVFKVKQRGVNSLEKIRRRSIDPREENIESLQYLAAAKSSETGLTLPKNLPGRREDGTMDLQFNWPYDYFSFVELIKLDAKIDSFNYLNNDE